MSQDKKKIKISANVSAEIHDKLQKIEKLKKIDWDESVDFLINILIAKFDGKKSGIGRVSVIREIRESDFIKVDQNFDDGVSYSIHWSRHIASSDDMQNLYEFYGKMDRYGIELEMKSRHSASPTIVDICQDLQRVDIPCIDPHFSGIEVGDLDDEWVYGFVFGACQEFDRIMSD